MKKHIFKMIFAFVLVASSSITYALQLGKYHVVKPESGAADKGFHICLKPNRDWYVVEAGNEWRGRWEETNFGKKRYVLQAINSQANLMTSFAFEESSDPKSFWAYYQEISTSGKADGGEVELIYKGNCR